MKRVFVVAAAAAAIGFLPAAVSAGQHGGMPPGGKMPAAADIDPQVKRLEQAAARLEKQLKAKPRDAKLKAAAADAFFKAGYASEYSKTSLPPAVRYRTALKHYRKALAYNPKHEKAKKEKAQIEMIYRQMGRPVPG